MTRKNWKASEIQNLLSMILDGFLISDLCLAFKCTRKQIHTACQNNFDMPLLFIKQIYKLRIQNEQRNTNDS